MQHVTFARVLTGLQPPVLYARYAEEEEHPPEHGKRHSVILSEEVRVVVKRHYHNGGQDAAKHRSGVKPACHVFSYR